MKRLIENLLLQVLAEPVLGLMHHLMGWLSNAVILVGLLARIG